MVLRGEAAVLSVLLGVLPLVQLGCSGAVARKGEAPVIWVPTAEAVKYVLVIAGQSNAMGQAQDPITNPAVAAHRFSRCHIWVPEQGWVLADPGNKAAMQSAFWDSTGGHHGIEPYLCYQFEALNPTGHLCIIKLANGSTHLEKVPGRLDWSSDSVGEYYDLLRTSYLAPALATLGSDYRPTVFWWMQGESDAMDPEAAAAYGDNLQAFFTDLRSTLPALRRFTTVVGRISTYPGWTFSAQVRAGQEGFCAVPGNQAFLIDSDDLPLSRLELGHYTSNAFDSLGTRVFGRMLPGLGLAVSEPQVPVDLPAR